MSIKPKDMVEYAYQLLKNGEGEMEHRNVINRAYYGAFLTARAAANITTDSGSVHQDVIKYYEDKKPIISNHLDSLKRDRQTADYKPRETIRVQTARKSCRIARKILTELGIKSAN